MKKFTVVFLHYNKQNGHYTLRYECVLGKTTAGVQERAEKHKPTACTLLEVWNDDGQLFDAYNKTVEVHHKNCLPDLYDELDRAEVATARALEAHEEFYSADNDTVG